MKHDNQLGYIPGMQDWFSIRKLISATCHIHNIEKINNKIIQKDAGKKIQIQHSFLIKPFKILEREQNSLNFIRNI